MSVENVKAFFKKLAENEVFRTTFIHDERIEKDNPETILAVAAAKGFPFTLNELQEAQEEK